ncbi:unnamed protein product, partial [Symbiodinium sp. CCMP2456]
MTTYSWRRLLPTVGQLLRLSPQEQLALGDWASNNPDGNQMPLHYSSARYTTSLRFKALSLAAAWEVRGFEDWSAITDTELERIKGAVRGQVDDVIVGGRTTIYQAPVTTETLHRSLALTRTWRLRAAKTRATSAKEQVAQMPATLNGKVLTAFLKNGQSLCARFQLGADEPVGNHAAEEATGSEERGRTESWHNYFDHSRRLFLAGLPTAATAQYFCKVALQVTCFDKNRDEEFAEVFTLTKNSLWAGEDVLYHCMAGRHPAATYGGLVRALLAFESLPVAYDHIKSLRDIEPEKVLRERFVGDFVHQMRRSIKIGQAAPAPTAYVATALSNIHIATNDIPLCKHNQAPSKALRHRNAWSTSDREEAVGWGISFCKGCDNECMDQQNLREQGRSAAAQSKRGVIVAMAMPSSVTLTPRDGTDIATTLQALGLNFGLDDKVVQALLATKVQNLEELRYFFADEGAVDPWLKKTPLGEEHNIQAARLRRCWAAVRMYFSQSEADRSKVALADLDCILGESELRDLKINFWRRYRQRYPPEVHPSDATVSRVSREMVKRMLCIFSVWKVKSLQHQLLSSVKKRKLAPNLYTEDDDPDEAGPRDAESYLDRLFTLCLAYAMAGTMAVSGAPAGTEEAHLGADSSLFVAVPLDVTMMYWFRAKRTAALVSSSRRLSWLQARDQEERTEWVARFRDSQKTLGQVIKEVFVACDPHWIPPSSGPPGAAAAPPEAPPTLPKADSLFQLLGTIAGKKVASCMKDGKQLCKEFQRGRCSKKDCTAGAHLCGVVIRQVGPGLGEVSSSPTIAESTQGASSSPAFLHLQPGPNTPLEKAFLWCGWHVLSANGVDGRSHDLADPGLRAELGELSSKAGFLLASMPGELGPRAGEVPESFDDVAADKSVGAGGCGDWILQQMDLISGRGGGCACEAPSNSPWWASMAEGRPFDAAGWHDLAYSTCVFAGARCKSQTIRHNIDELAQGPPLACQHVHDASEWEPYALGDSIVYPSHEESECTAPLAFFLAVSATGRREHWLHIDPDALRSRAMAPLAISLGLRPAQIPGAAELPVRALAEDTVVDKDVLPSGCIYVGQGNYQHRLPTSQWRSPWVAGLNCDPAERLTRYAEFILTELWNELDQLWGMTLLCDCPLDVPCEADVLAGLLFDCRRGEPGDHHCKASALWWPERIAPRTALLRGSRIGQAVPVLFRQEAIILRFRKLFPAEWFRGFRFPMIEDIINQAPFDSFGRWLVARGDEWEGPLVPIAAERQQRFRQRTADGQQIGASSHRAAIPPLLPFGLTADEHFEQSLQLGTRPLPTELHPILDTDLIFAADMHAKHRGSLRAIRQQTVGALKELKRRWESVGERLRTLQPKALREATRYRDLGLTALLIILISWGDVTYPFGLVQGLPAVGFAPSYGVFPTQQAHVISFEDVLGDWQAHNAVTIRRLRLDEVLLEQSRADADQGFCTPPLSLSSLQRELRGNPFRVIPQCVITQGSGKHRIIDNAAEGGQSAASSDASKLVLCSPLRPAQHLRATVSLMSEEELERARDEDAWETGGEDWPNAYRHSPMSSTEARACVVCFWHHEWQQPAFQLYAGLLFGLPLAVTSFNRYSRLVEALGRRLVSVLVSLYFDDASLGDWASSRGSGQWAFEQLNGMLGTPFAESKRQPMSSRGDFLGLSHDMSKALSDGVIRFCQASKLYGILNFFEQGVYGKVTPDLLDNFRYLRAVIRARPKRQLPVFSLPCGRFVCASDAAEEPATGGTGGFLIVWFDGSCQTRQGFVADVQPWWYSVWQPAEVHIAQLEISTVAYALLGCPDRFRNRKGIWFLDNITSLMALVKGRSSSKDLEAFAHMVHILLLGLNTQMWFQYVPSKSNWA